MADLHIRVEADKARAIDAIRALDLTRPFVMSLKRKQERRSLNQNALFHKWCGEIGNEIGEAPEDVKRILKDEFLPKHEIRIGDESYMVPPSTASLSVPEMANFMTQVQALAGRMGWFLTHPEDQYAEAMR